MFAPAPKAPQPGILPLRPLNVGENVGIAFNGIKKHFAVSFLVPLLMSLAPAIIIGALVAIVLFSMREIFSVGYSPSGAQVTTLIGLGAIAMLVMIVSQVTMQGALVHAFSRAAIGAKPGVSESIRAGLRRSGALILLGFLMFLAMLAAYAVMLLVIFFVVGGAVAASDGKSNSGANAGAVFLMIPIMLLFFCAFAFFAIRLSFAPFVIVMEEAPAMQGLSRSWKLTKGRFWRTFGNFLLLYLVTMVVSYAFQFLFFFVIGAFASSIDSSGTPGGTGLVVGIILAVVALVTYLFFVMMMTPYMTYGIAAVYADARMRDEGLAQQLYEMSHNSSGQLWNSGPQMAETRHP